VTGVSLVPAVRLPSSRMRLLLVWAVVCVCIHRSRSVVMRVCMLMRLGACVGMAAELIFKEEGKHRLAPSSSCVSRLCWLNSWVISCLFSSVMWNGKGPNRVYR